MSAFAYCGTENLISMENAERKEYMAKINEKGTYEFPGLFQGGRSIVTLPTGDALLKQGRAVRDQNGEVSKAFVHVDTPLDDVVFNCIATIPGEDGKDIPVIAQLSDDGTMFLTRSKDVASVRTGLRAMVSIDGNFEDYGMPVGEKICDPMFPNLGDWLVVSPTEAISMDRDVFKDVSILGRNEDVLERAKLQMYETFRDGVERDQFEYNYNKVEEALSDSELYVDEKEKESVLKDFRAGKELVEEIERTGGASSVVNKVRETTIEFGSEFESHARKLLNFAKGIGAKVKDFFNKGEVVSADELKKKGIDEETAYAIHDEAELRQESQQSLHKFGDVVRETVNDIKEKGVFALAGIFKKVSDLKINHYERMQAKEEKHLEAALDRIRARARREGNVKAAEARVKLFVNDIWKSIGNIGIAISNASGNLTKAVTFGAVNFDSKPYHPVFEGGDICVTRSALNTALYRFDDNRLINSTLHLAQIKAKLFHEHISATPMAKREKTADMLLGQMAEKIGKADLMNRVIEYATLEGMPAQQVQHTLEFTNDGLVVDGENMKENGYEGLSRKLSPNAMMHLMVQSERQEMVYRVAIAENAAPEIVQALNNENARMAYNIGTAYERNENFVSTMSGVHKDLQDANDIMKHGYTFADKLQEKADMEAEEGIDEESLEECFEH